MSKTFEFKAAIDVRAYGTITVKADNLESAIAEVSKPEFQMSKHFSPCGSGDDDFDFDVSLPDTYLEYVTINGGEEIELDLSLDDER